MSSEFDKPRISFEFFPPRTEQGRDKLKITRQQLNRLNPSFFSVTYGAGGSTRENTQAIVLQMKEEGLSVAPHLSFGGDSDERMATFVNTYKNAGIDRIVALRGDIPSGMGGSRPAYAEELVAFIREKTADYFHIEVAAYPEIHPESSSYDSDIKFLKAKLDAGANSAITQYFYNTDAYFYFVEACQKQGIDKPIVPGVMPISNLANLKRFSENCGAEIPRWFCKRVEALGEDQDSINAFSIEFVSKMCQKLLEGGAPGIHFYTMNQYDPTASILKNLSL